MDQIVKDVIAGKYGAGAERINKLKAAGYDPAQVQTAVNDYLNPKEVLRVEVDLKKISGIELIFV